jgi:hypothetical protein
MSSPPFPAVSARETTDIFDQQDYFFFPYAYFGKPPAIGSGYPVLPPAPQCRFGARGAALTSAHFTVISRIRYCPVILRIAG